MKDSFKAKIHEIIFEAETPKGKAFDVALIYVVVLSIVVVMLESIPELRTKYRSILFGLEWFFTIIFTIEYGLRLYCVKRPLTYASSFFGLVDLFSIIPTYISFLVPGAQSLLVIRAIRLLRVFRVLKLSRFTMASNFLSVAVSQSRHKIAIFLGVVLTSVTISGALMYLVEGGENGFTSIPKSVYWAIVTMTTVGYGDISPQTPLGQFLASILMISGYGVIAVPTGIVSSEMLNIKQGVSSTQVCRDCSAQIHNLDAKFCHQCATKIE